MKIIFYFAKIINYEALKEGKFNKEKL